MNDQAVTGTVAGKHEFADLVGRWRDLQPQLARRRQDDGMAWLSDALHAAIQLEFSTIPPYLCALWSIDDQSAPVAMSIRQIVQEEMLHMAIACNMLVAIGGTPRIASKEFAPVYPGHLAGGVHPDLIVGLSGLTDEALRAFMTIELPELGPDEFTGHIKAASGLEIDRDAHDTIGDFYDSVLEAFRMLAPALCADRQVSGPLSWFSVTSLTEIERAIGVIKHQGEGSAMKPHDPFEAVPGDGDVPQLAHFYRFLEIYKGRQIVWSSAVGSWDFGDELPRPSVRPMAPVPPGGYHAATLPPEVATRIDEFDKRYTALLVGLERLWETGDQGELVRSIEMMFGLEETARELMQIPIGNGTPGNYGPCFRLRAADQ